MVNKLSEEDYLSTFNPPMLLWEEDQSLAIDLREYVNEIIIAERLSIVISDIEIQSIYHNSESTFEHILLNYGIEDMFIVLVVNLVLENIFGYYILDLKDKYDLNK